MSIELVNVETAVAPAELEGSLSASRVVSRKSSLRPVSAGMPYPAGSHAGAGKRPRDVENSGKLPLQEYAYGFASPEIAAARRQYLIIMGRVTLLIVILIWVTLPVYWGSIASSAKLTPNLGAWFIDHDNSKVGHQLWSAFSNATHSESLPRLNWTYISSEEAGTDEQIVQGIVDEYAWVAVVVSKNATFHWQQARQNGNSSYEPTSAITVYYESARFSTVTSTYVVPIMTTLLQKSTTAFATSSAQDYLADIYAQGTVNSTALQLLTQAPQTISPAISWTVVDLRPYTAPAAMAVTLVGNVFLCIFAFVAAMAHNTARGHVERYLRMRSYLVLRLGVPLIVYLPVSISYCLVGVAFHLPLSAKFGSQTSGFFVFLAYVYLGIASLGLALEAMITILGLKYTPFFLFTLIVINLSASTMPNDVQPSLYSYAAATPAWNLSQAALTIVFNTHSHLGRNVGVLFGWILMNCVTISLFTWGLRTWKKHQMRKMRKAMVARDNKSPMASKTASKVELSDEKVKDGVETVMEV